MTLADLEALMLGTLDGGYGSVTLSYFRPMRGEGKWVFEARGEKLPVAGSDGRSGRGFWQDGPTLDKVLPEPPTAG